MSGSGTEVGSTFEQLAAILEKIDLRDHVGVCFDACRVWGAGYDIVDDLDGVVEEFDRVIGLDKLWAVHLNDSVDACGSHKDRHAPIGDGRIGLPALAAMVNHRLRAVPFYLEAPGPTLAEVRCGYRLLHQARANASASCLWRHDSFLLERMPVCSPTRCHLSSAGATSGGGRTPAVHRRHHVPVLHGAIRAAAARRPSTRRTWRRTRLTRPSGITRIWRTPYTLNPASDKQTRDFALWC